ncbi:MAG: hypothetical protein ACTS3R_01290 [Inquilinaceae bacterium]
MAAPEITTEGADEIRLAIKSYIARAAGPEAEGALSIGRVSVTPGSDGYDATIPDIVVETDGGDIITIGDIVLYIAPRDDGWYDLSWTLPDTIPIQLIGEPPMALTFGDQRGSAVVVPSIENVIQSDFALTEVILASTTNRVLARLDSITSFSDYDRVEPDRFDIMGDVRIAGLTVQPHDGGNTLRVAEILMEGGYQRASIERLAQMMADLQTQAVGDGAGSTSSGDFSTRQIASLSAAMRMIPEFVGGASVFYGISGLVMEVDGERWVVPDMSLAMAMTDLDTDRSAVSVTFDAGDARGLVPEGLPAGLAPIESRIALRLSDLPADILFDGLADAIEGSAGTDPEMAMAMIGMTLQAAVMEAGSVLAIDRVLVVNETSRFDATGVVRPDPSAAFGVTADVTILFTGMEALIETFQGMGPDEEETVQALTLFSALGAEATDATGNPARRYDIVVLPSGQATLNGTDVAPLLEMMR